MNRDCDSLGIPPRLHINGRGVMPFDINEDLYIRVKPEHKLPDGSISQEALSTQRQSCNRSKYCDEPTDVLFNINSPVHFVSWCIIAIRVSDLEKISVQHPEQDKKLTYRIEHQPEKCMYPHSEIVLLKAGIEVKRFKPRYTRHLLKSAILQVATEIPTDCGSN